MSNSEQVVLSTTPAAKYLGSTTGTLRVSRATGMLWGQPCPKFIKAGNRKILYRKAALDDFLNQFQEISNTSQAGG